MGQKENNEKVDEGIKKISENEAFNLIFADFAD